MDSLLPALELVREFEGCKLKAYQDIVGIWTIGWGDTDKVTPGMEITQEEADRRLVKKCLILESNIWSVLRTGISDNAVCALISFSYNLGWSNFFHSTLLTMINSGVPLEECAEQFARWNHAGGQVVDGLTRRREAEAELFIRI